MTKLEKSVEEWVQKGIINQQQAAAILHHENTITDRSWVFYGFLVLGALIIGLGVISIIAANWDNIPAGIKLFSNFSCLSIIAIVMLHAFTHEKKQAFETLKLIFIIFCLSSIGLISQIYNTGGELYESLMLWSVMTFPIVIFSRTQLSQMTIPFIWLGAFILGLIYTLTNSPFFFTYYHFNIYSIAMGIPAFCIVILLMAKYFSFDVGYLRAIQTWIYISGLIAIGIMETSDPASNEFAVQHAMLPYYPAYLVTAISAIGIWFEASYNKAQKIVLLLAFSIYVIGFHLFLIAPHSSFIYALATLTILALISIFTASIHQQRLFNWLLFIIGLRFLWLYFEALGGLATTGLGLIISGLMIISLTYYWYKYRNNIANQLERWMQ